MKIIILLKEGDAADYHRLVNPFSCLTLKQDEKLRLLYYKEIPRVGDFRTASVVVVNRSFNLDLDFILGLRKRFGFFIWVDLDDYWILYKTHYLFDYWEKFKSEEKMIETLKIADVVTVTNKRLMLKALEHNKKVVVVPNALPMNAGFHKYISQKTESEKLRFMFAGGPSHADDLSTISEFFDECGRDIEFQRKSQFILAGYAPQRKDDPWIKMYNTMKSTGNLLTRHSLPVTSYMEHYNHADVSLAPLEGNEFNTYKSNLKTIEAGCMRMPIMVSNQYPYLEDIEAKDKGVIFCQDHNEWYKNAKWLIKNPNAVSDLGSKLREYVSSKYELDDINKIRREILDNLKKA